MPFPVRFLNPGIRLVRGRTLSEVNTLVCHFTNKETGALRGEGFPPMISQQESSKVGSRSQVSWLRPLPRVVMDKGCYGNPQLL